jgi:hypothetical protein
VRCLLEAAWLSGPAKRKTARTPWDFIRAVRPFPSSPRKVRNTANGVKSELQTERNSFPTVREKADSAIPRVRSRYRPVRSSRRNVCPVLCYPVRSHRSASRCVGDALPGQRVELAAKSFEISVRVSATEIRSAPASEPGGDDRSAALRICRPADGREAMWVIGRVGEARERARVLKKQRRPGVAKGRR